MSYSGTLRHRESRALAAVACFTIVLIAMAGAACAGAGDDYICEAPKDSIPGDWVPPFADTPKISSAVIRLVIYAVRDSAGAGGFSYAQIDTILERVRADYSASGIRFEIAIRDTLDTSLMSVANPWPPVRTARLSAALVWRPDLQMSRGSASGSPAGLCWVKLTGTDAASVLSHELGHCLGLLHTFHRAYDSDGSGPSTCAIGGDLVCDTPFDSLGEGLREEVDPDTCEGTPEARGIDVTNIMAYTWPHCMDHFTGGQIDRMLYLIEADSLLNAAWVRPAVVYENKSDDTELDYEGTPYSSATLDYNADGKKDLFISMRDNFGSLQRQYQLSQSGVPQFTDRTELDIAEAGLPQAGLRGVAAADYNNDGHMDLFAAADSNPRMYHNNSGAFADSAAALGLASLADSSYVGVWGDFDRDGQIDLYVGRSSGGGDDPTSSNLVPARGRLLRNDLRSAGSFSDCTDSLGSPANAYGASVAASWADMDGDGDLDLFVGDLRDAVGSASSRFYINDGAGAFTESFASRFSGLDIENVNSVVWADMNNDGELDLVLGSESAAPTVYFNDGAGDFTSQNPLLATLEAPTNMVRPVDVDLDGAQDLIAVPRATTDHRWLFWNRVIGDQRELLDQSWAVGFADSTGRVDGLAMADFNGDGDSDIYFGRPVDTGDIFYRAAADSNAGDNPGIDWVGVRLVAGDANNSSAIGARVRFYIGSTFEQLQIVDGGSGKGGQADNVLICGLSDLAGSVQAEIMWPGGFVQTASLTRNQVNTITDDTVPGVPTSVSGVYTALPEGQAELTFTWETPYSCKPSLDKVTITDRPRQPSQCPLGTVVLTPSSDNVTHAVLAKVGGGYRHTLTWPLECRAPCAYDFLIESAADATHKSQMAQTAQISTPVCISQ